MLKIKQNISLAPYTTLKIGGPADYFTTVKNQTKLIEVLKWARAKNIPYYILGNGSNVLIPDQGLRGLVIKLLITNCQLLNNILTVGAGASMSLLAKKTATAGLSGLEFGIGIPGTVGGAVYGNAGAFSQEIKDTLTSVQILMPKKDFADHLATKNNCSTVKSLSCYVIAKNPAASCQFAYRDSIFKKHKNWIILKAQFKLKKDTVENCQTRMGKMLTDKKKHQPLGEASAGSIFKNPPGQKAWELISEAGMKGYTIGQAKVSNQHANYIINMGGATAKQVIMLIAMIKQRVRAKLGQQLQEEIQYLGF